MTKLTSEDQIDALVEIGPGAADASAESRHLAALHNLFARRHMVPDSELVKQLGIWHPQVYTARLIMFADLWRNHIQYTAGSVLLFGVRYGQDLTWLIQLRGLIEPYSRRPIIAFDTFEGHKGHTDIDGDDWMVQDGAFDVAEGYESYIYQVAAVHANAARLAGENYPPIVEIVKGDVRETLPALLEGKLSSLVVGAAFFDLDIYEPTVAALQAVLPRCHAKTLLVFDELDANRMPGETHAVLDTVGLGGLSLERDVWDTMSWTTLEGL